MFRCEITFCFLYCFGKCCCLHSCAVCVKRDSLMKLLFWATQPSFCRISTNVRKLCFHIRCYGKVPDVAACAFFKVQFEDQLKKSADRAIKVLQTSPVDLNTAAQIVTEDGIETNIPPMKGLDQVHWVHAFPFPLKARSYRLVQRLIFTNASWSTLVSKKQKQIKKG